MSEILLDWNAIRPLNGSRAHGFEELCTQLAEYEIPANSQFIRKGAPDGGVECFAILGDGSEWGWQAKYFDTLSSSQWSQLDGSVRTALEKHPLLVRYFICVPLDRPDARIVDQKSAMDNWNIHVAKWGDWAKERGMTVEFVFWGSHELLNLMAKPQHLGRVYFWFNIRGFDKAWYSDRISEAFKTAGPRYTPSFNIHLPIAAEFEAFGRTEYFITEIKSRFRDLRKEKRGFEHSRTQLNEAQLTSAAQISESIDQILNAVTTLRVQPVGQIPFNKIESDVRAARSLVRQLEQTVRESDLGIQGQSEQKEKVSGPFKDLKVCLNRLSLLLSDSMEALKHADELANRQLLILTGTAGTGKTHLLCDVARHRVESNLPTVLLMGQQFISNQPPSIQALQLLDLAGISISQFVGSLEASAQAAKSRALVIIDALNEGEGVTIWPSHLASFLSHLERSPWIAVVLSVRSSYEHIIVPEEIKDKAAHLTHYGFFDHQYDATKEFFLHYGLEFPSTPLLSEEFGNPLFLSTLCKGLKAKGLNRVPRGFHGISAVFELLLSAVNQTLSKQLGYDPNDKLVQKALIQIAELLADLGKRWCKRIDAKETVESLLESSAFERSLFRGLISEGVLIEETAQAFDLRDNDQVIMIAYDRFADHLIAKAMLDKHATKENLEQAFISDGPLGSLADKSLPGLPGLLEAFCIQIPERFGRELITLDPRIAEHWAIGSAFRQSLVWRSLSAFSNETYSVINALTQSEEDSQEIVDALLAVSMVPGHPLNAELLDKRLRKDTMPDRDAWWSIHLHHLWGQRSSLDRLLDWAYSINEELVIDSEAVFLSATTIAWTLSSSNRFLRDRATQSLVNLLTGRIDAVRKLIEQFHDIDDPYIVERVYAVAYGVAMRSHKAIEVGKLAQTVYDLFFASGCPIPQILTRDYARGVVERANYLKSNIDVDMTIVRPPYKSNWPQIPTEDEIKSYLPDWTVGSHSSLDVKWARNRIGYSVQEGDFARYVIGTNSWSENWLATKLGHKPQEKKEKKFDITQMQKYILKRVFELGWTTERFGYFDRFTIDTQGREASKAERIGKKYQWIAYHEILALIADHYQYHDECGSTDGRNVFQGPWQEYLRDIDPSCTIRKLPGGTAWEGHSVSWWCNPRYENFGEDSNPGEWVTRHDNLPKLGDLLISKRGDSKWINAQGFFSFKQQPPSDREISEVEQRELWYICTGYLIHSKDAEAFLSWSRSVNFWGRWMPEPPEIYRMFLGEYGWAPASKYFESTFYRNPGWNQPDNDCPVEVMNLAFEYLREASGFDCSVEDTFTLRLPTAHLIKTASLKWTGHGGDYADSNGRLAAQDPTFHVDGPSALLIREDVLSDILRQEDLVLCWEILGEKRVFGPGFGGRQHPALQLSGACLLDGSSLKGFIKCAIDNPSSYSTPPPLLYTIEIE